MPTPRLAAKVREKPAGATASKTVSESARTRIQAGPPSTSTPPGRAPEDPSPGSSPGGGPSAPPLEARLRIGADSDPGRSPLHFDPHGQRAGGLVPRIIPGVGPIRLLLRFRPAPLYPPPPRRHPPPPLRALRSGAAH